MEYGNNQVRMNLDSMKTAMEACGATATTVKAVIGDVKTTLTDLEDDFIGEDADTLQNEMKSYLDNQVNNICLNAKAMKKALEQGLEKARYCKNYCQHFVDALNGGANEATNDNEEISGAMFCDYDAVEGLMEMCTEAERLGEEIRQSTYEIDNVVNLEVVSFDVTYYTSAVREECDKIDRLGTHRSNLVNYASFVDNTDAELAGALGGIYDTFVNPKSVERRKQKYRSINAKIKKVRKSEEIREELIKQYGEDIVYGWGEVTLIGMQENMRGLPVKYTDEEMINILEMCQTKEDRAFIKLLLQGKYDEAFALSPNELSPEISYVLADYSAHLIRYNGKGRYEEGVEEFADFNNAMLASDDYICIVVDGVRTYVGEKYWERYLDMMTEGGALRLKTEAISLSLMNPYEENYDMSYYHSCYASYAILSTEDSIKGELQSRDENFRCGISDMKFNDDGTILLGIQHYSPRYGEDVSDVVSISFMKDASEVKQNNDQSELNQAWKKQEECMNEFVYSVCKDGSLTALSYFAPQAAMLTSVTMMALEGSAGTVSGASSLVGENWQKMAVDAGNALLANTINTVASLQATTQNMNETNHKVLMEAVGCGAKYNVYEGKILDNTDSNIAFVGIYNPDVLRALSYWNSNGISGWIEEDSANAADIYDKIVNDGDLKDAKINDYNDNNKKYTYDEFLEQCSEILFGGATSVEKGIDMELISDAIEQINAKGDINLEEELRDWIKRERGVAPDNSASAEESD